MNSFNECNEGRKLRGMNLGGWLLLEKWITPSLFDGLAATDETAYCAELGEQADVVLKQHWNTFITRDDFAWLAGVGINAVRIPVGHWLFGSGYPYHRAYGASEQPYVVGGLDILDKAFDWAEAYGVQIVLDLHAAPGCQNGFDNGGIMGVCEWHTRTDYVEHSLNVLENLAARYSGRRALHAIEVLNEPRWDIPTDFLKCYNQSGYARIRKHCRPEDVAVVFHDGFRSFHEYIGFMREPEFRNVVFDIHRYQCFDRDDIDLDIYGHIIKSAVFWKQEAEGIIKELRLPAYVGVWSLGLCLREESLSAGDPSSYALEAMDTFQIDVGYRAHAAAQLATFEKYRGWFFWTYKTETRPEWCFRECVERGWLPAKFA
ncbi:MAG: glycoside hydrolase family 5 protein [Gammaproteobacteria bacterium]